MEMPKPPDPQNPRILSAIGDILIGVQTDLLIVPGKQWIYITNRNAGLSLADFLSEDWSISNDLQWVVLAHTADVDHRLKQLLDMAAAIRMAAPDLVQLTFIVDENG